MRPVYIIIPSNRVELCGGGLERLQSGAGRSIMVSLSPALIMTAVIIGVLIKRAERVTARLEDDSVLKVSNFIKQFNIYLLPQTHSPRWLQLILIYLVSGSAPVSGDDVIASSLSCSVMNPRNMML